jgi:hypothetical protein
MTSGIDESPQAPPVAVAPSGTPPKGPVQRVVGALFAPDDTFDDIARRPDILVPLLLILVIGIASAVVVVPRIDFESMFRTQFESNKNMSAEDVNRMIPIMVASAKVFGYAGSVFVVAYIAIIAGILLLAFRVLGGEGGYKQAFSVALYSWLPQVISGLIATIIVLGRGGVTGDEMQTILKSNLGAFVDPKEQMIAFAFLSSIDIFTIWTIVLLIIGFAHVARMSKAKTAGVILPLWLIAVLIKVGFAALGAARMKQT